MFYVYHYATVTPQGTQTICVSKFKGFVWEYSEPGGGGDSHIKVTGVLVGFFESDPKRYQDVVLWAWPQVNFTPKRYLIRNIGK